MHLWYVKAVSNWGKFVRRLYDYDSANEDQ